MGFISFILMQLMAAYTVLVEPFLRTNFYRNLKKQLNSDPEALILYYRTQVLWELSWVVVLIVILIPIPQPIQWIGINMPSSLGWTIMAILVLGIGFSAFLLQRNPKAMANVQRSLEANSTLLPKTQAERKWFATAAIITGVCEELLYRGFLINYMSVTFPGLYFLIMAIISGIVYGISRAYLGRKGILQTTLSGFSYAVVYFLSGNLLAALGSSQPMAITGSLIPAMVFHILAELRSLWLWQPEEKKKE